MTSTLSKRGISALLLDIEGTTTPIAFVHEVLFSYARSRLRDYLTEHFTSKEVRADLAALRHEHAADLKSELPPPTLVDGPPTAEIDSFVAYINWLMDRDRKSTGLKSLQGKIWKQGYLAGILKAQVFSDVRPALERWSGAGLKVNIFSSGSTLAQQLLFAHTDAGNLTTYLNNYFDTTVGSKIEAESYRKIAAILGVPAGNVLFISDISNELAAASEAGMQILLCVRPGNRPQISPAANRTIESFEELKLEN